MTPLRIKAFLLLVFACAAACAQTERAKLANVSVEQLKTAYLDCDRRSSRSVLDPGSARACSLMAEELLQRGFSGDFDKLIAWWRSEVQRSERVVTDPPASPAAALSAV